MSLKKINMNKIRTENAKANINRDENFFVIDEDRYNSTYLSVLLIANRDDKISKEALGLTSILLSISPFNRNIFDNSIHRINFNFREGYGKYFLRCSLTEPLNQKTIIEPRMKMGKRLMKTIDSGWSKRSCDLKRALDIVKYKYAELDADPIFQLDRMMQLNFLTDLPLGKYPYGKLEKVQKINHLDIDLAIEYLLKSNRMATYIGNTNYRFVLASRNKIKPTIKIFPLTLPQKILPRGNNLEIENDSFKGNYVGFAFNLSQVHSEKVKLCHDILLAMLFNETYGIMNDYLIDNNCKVIDVKLFVPTGCFCVYLYSYQDISIDFIEEFERKVIDTYTSDIASNFILIKHLLLNKLKEGFNNPEDLADYLFEGRLAGLDYSLATMNDKLNSITEEDFIAYSRKINLIGSIRIKGCENE